MQVEYQKDRKKAKTAEFFVLGSCLAIDVDQSTHRIALSRGQWKALADIAKRKAEGEEN